MYGDHDIQFTCTWNLPFCTGCLENSDLETSDLRPQTSDLETSDLEKSDLETSDPLKNDWNIVNAVIHEWIFIYDNYRD